jgi:hypothetical protein
MNYKYLTIAIIAGVVIGCVHDYWQNKELALWE